MPATSAAQQRYMAMCAHNAGAAKGKCPPQDVAEEFSHKPKGGYRSKRKGKRGPIPKDVPREASGRASRSEVELVHMVYFVALDGTQFTGAGGPNTTSIQNDTAASTSSGAVNTHVTYSRGIITSGVHRWAPFITGGGNSQSLGYRQAELQEIL